MVAFLSELNGLHGDTADLIQDDDTA
jgi:hypothetical protein